MAFSERNDIKYIYKQTNKREKKFHGRYIYINSEVGSCMEGMQVTDAGGSLYKQYPHHCVFLLDVYDHVFSFVFNWLSFQNLLGLLYSHMMIHHTADTVYDRLLP